MTELYLIAHKCRGEPAFDVAQRIGCAECLDLAGTNYGCNECDQLGYWWIVPTSGHRAYPYWEIDFDGLASGFIWEDVGPPPDGLQDHYVTQAAPTRSLTDLLNLRPKPVAPILRRI